MSRTRRMTSEDLSQVVKLEKETFSQPWSEKGFEEALLREENCFIVIEDTEIYGYCGYYKVLDEAEVMNVCIRKDSRNRGLGRIMMEALIKEARDAKVSNMILEVRVSNASAIHLYEKLGFVSLGIRKDFYEMPREDAMIMQYLL